MRTYLRLLAIFNAALWGFLLAQNLDRYFHGWGETVPARLYGSVPLAGLIAAVIIFRLVGRGEYRKAKWLASITTICGILYFGVAELPNYADAPMLYKSKAD